MKSLIFKIKWLLKFRIRFLLKGKSRKNIALVVNSFNKGGLEQVVLNLYYGYKKQGYNVYILSAFNDAPLAKNLFDLRDIYIFNNNPEKFIEFCYKKDINVLHYHYNTLMMRAARQMGFKIIYTMHNVYTWFSHEEFINYKGRLDSAHRVACVSSYVKDYYTKITGAQNAVAIPNGLEFSRLDKDYDNFNLTRSQLNISQNTTVLVMVASFYPVKHQIGMIGAMEQLIKKHPDTLLLCLGNIGDKEYYRAFNQILNTSPAKENIKHIEYIDNQFMGQFLRTVPDIFVLPTLQEGFGNSTIEALYCGLPAVVTDSGCARDIKKFNFCKVTPCAYDDITTVTKEQMDILSLQKDNINTQDIADAIGDIIENLSDYTLSVKKAKKEIEEFSLDNMIKKYIELL